MKLKENQSNEWFKTCILHGIVCCRGKLIDSSNLWVITHTRECIAKRTKWWKLREYGGHI